MAENMDAKTHVGDSGSANRDVNVRHPSTKKERESEDVAQKIPTYTAAGECNCDSKDQHGDAKTYVVDDFEGSTEAPPIIPSPDGGAWGREFVHLGGEGHDYSTVDWSRSDTTWFGPDTVGSGPWEVISKPASWPDADPPGCSTSPRWHALGERYREIWYPLVVPAHPADAAGINVQAPSLNDHANVYNDHKSEYSKVSGYQLRVASAKPTARRDGALVSVFLGAGVQPAPLLFIPIEHIPAEGATVWIGFTPNWDTIPGTPNGQCWGSLENINGQSWPTLDMQAAGSDDGGGDHRILAPIWQSFEVGEIAFGNGSDGEEQDAWFAGNLPWTVTAVGATWMTEDGKLKVTGGVGGGKVTLRMEGADISDLTEDYEGDDVGEPWTHEHGVRMVTRLKVDLVNPDTDVGVRGVTMRWNDHSGWVETRVHFGDPTDAMGLTLTADGVSDNQGGLVVADIWYPVWMDTRLFAVVRGRAWAEGDPLFPFSGETWRKLEVARDAFFDHEDDNALEIIIDAGDGQTVELDGVFAIGPGEDGQVIHEHLGSGDGIRTAYWTSQPFLRDTLRFSALGLKVRALELNGDDGSFQSVDGLPVPDEGRMEATYVVDRTLDDEDVPDATEDDWADDPDFVP